MPCIDALADNLGVLGGLFAQELPECGDVEADEATSALSDDAVLEKAAFVLACVVAGDAHAFGYLRDPVGQNRAEGCERKTGVALPILTNLHLYEIMDSI